MISLDFRIVYKVEKVSRNHFFFFFSSSNSTIMPFIFKCFWVCVAQHTSGPPCGRSFYQKQSADVWNETILDSRLRLIPYVPPTPRFFSRTPITHATSQCLTNVNVSRLFFWKSAVNVAKSEPVCLTCSCKVKKKVSFLINFEVFYSIWTW